MSENFSIGDIVLSLSGRDKGQYFLLVDIEDKYAFIANGKSRKVKALKKKNLKHLKSVKIAVLTEIAIRIQSGQPVGNQILAKAIKSELQKNRRIKFVSKDDVIETEGVIVEALPNATFTVKLSNGHIITAYISGKLRMHYIKIIPGDSVKLEMSPYDLTKGRIIWRSKN